MASHSFPDSMTIDERMGCTTQPPQQTTSDMVKNNTVQLQPTGCILQDQSTQPDIVNDWVDALGSHH
jgi:hypothetical protein